MKRFFIAAILATAPALVTLATPTFASDTALAPEISLDDVKKAIETKSALIIDVNSEATYTKGHIPGAVNYAKNAKTFASVLPKDKTTTVIAYCGGPMCSAWEDAAKAAKALGYTNIKHFKGGIKGWTDAGQKVEKGG